MFSERPEIPADLVFVGGGPDRAQIEMAAQVDSRISVKPFLHGREYAEEVANADFLLNARDPNWRGSRYSFPSKLFEYMSLEVPILSTRMAGIPDEYFRCFFCIHDNDPEKFAVSLLEALNASDAELASRIAVGRKIVTKHKSPEAVGATLLYALRET
ncbi:hypothetical protein GCM10007937_45150 [Mesorhizobium albiziae]|nr:hypothetical protein GCM10007937_45150 [Mesorhizobium albiziae]